ncbi:GNAT family N-acetyltransferase [Amycolatopsis sp. SID8362]|uniref:GNAT family N-acetyltransferase n=1 Tax=Amycolatopsis sp. SID8362 TaxID=2690346 RepID=UPI00136846AB|nr:GNAT family N-acetyltransferase [Amycolatopsis sp. SID8362]NBH03734.1 GNAT family N-acetyltransferase [Amycolatopsis sp. SID8362]NED40434.1 GNAT family N-acetyltransferase [Amycolatopsis sp. SID8362]
MLTVRPVDQVAWTDLQAIFGDRGDPARCRCQYFKDTPAEWRSGTPEERAERLREQTSERATGIVAFLDGEPAGWCAVEPRTAYRRLLKSRVVWDGRDEDPADDGVWAVTCFVTRKGFRRRGVSAALAKAAVDFARERGAKAVEGYPIVVEAGEKLAWPGELFVGTRKTFADAGFEEVSRPTARRVVMRLTC